VFATSFLILYFNVGLLRLTFARARSRRRG
jgi:hypothetical protein